MASVTKAYCFAYHINAQIRAFKKIHRRLKFALHMIFVWRYAVFFDEHLVHYVWRNSEFDCNIFHPQLLVALLFDVFFNIQNDIVVCFYVMGFAFLLLVCFILFTFVKRNEL